MTRFIAKNCKGGFSRIIFNMIGRPVIAYTEEGEMIKLYPVDDEINLPDRLKEKVAYLVSDQFYDNLSPAERKEKDYVHIIHQGVGRNGVEIVTISAFDVGGDGKIIRVLPAGKADYKYIDPANYKIIKA